MPPPKPNVAGEGGDDRPDGVAVPALARERAVEIDDVEVAGPCVGEEQSLRGRVVAVDRSSVHVAFGQPYHLPTLQVDRGEDDQGRHVRNLSSSAMP